MRGRDESLKETTEGQTMVGRVGMLDGKLGLDTFPVYTDSP
jgi:hypothetical protein